MTRDWSLLSLWNATSTDLPNILLLQTVHLTEGTKWWKVSCLWSVQANSSFLLLSPLPAHITLCTSVCRSISVTKVNNNCSQKGNFLTQSIPGIWFTAELYRQLITLKWGCFLNRDLGSYLHDWRSEGPGRELNVTHSVKVLWADRTCWFLACVKNGNEVLSSFLLCCAAFLMHSLYRKWRWRPHNVKHSHCAFENSLFILN